MKQNNPLRKSLFGLLFFFSSLGTSFASHLYGGDLFYTHISGNKYNVTMVLYGDCAGTASVFAALYTATPQVQVYNGTSLFRTMNLKVLPGAGTEVTPICASSLGSSACSGGTVPGVKRFEYADTITLSPATAWRLRFNGNLTSSSVSGRSASITNISSSGSTLMSLEATLNNSSASNSNPTFTTIPTPFFCINVAQEYNQGAVDPNSGDSLVYTLVDGLDASTTPSSYVTYLTGYSATSPLACATGTFSFSSSTGQLTFKPNLAQVSLVVCKVSEYRGGVLVGSCMREMNFIVLSTCSNRSPYGKISGVSGGTAISNTVVNICKNQSSLSFAINPIDSDGNNITVSYAGLPIGATLSVTGSGTASPSCSFNWDITSVATGTYYFYVTYQDDACPLSSKQTVVYTINVLAKPLFTVNTISLTTCDKKAVFDVLPSLSSGGPWTLKAYSGTTLLHTITSTTSIIRDSLPIGPFVLRLTNANGCYEDLNYAVVSPPTINIQSCITKPPLCNGSGDGSISIVGTGGLSPFQYQLNTGSFVSIGTFTGLAAGTYSLRIKDANNCFKDTIISLINPLPITIKAIPKNPLCNAKSDGSVTLIASGGKGGFSYSAGTSGSFGASNYFGSLAAGSYTFRVKDTNNCIQTISISLVDSVTVSATTIVTDLSCFNVADGVINLIPSIGKSPFSYALGSSSYSAIATFNSLAAGTYVNRFKDSFGCNGSTTAVVNQPAKLNLSLSIIPPSCHSFSDGSINILGTGGTTPYVYSLNGKPFVGTALFSSLIANTYSITVKDAKGCLKDTSILMTEPAPINFSTKIISPLCNGDKNGSVLISANGGSPLFTYANDALPFQTDSLITDLSAKSYLIKVKDKNGCTKDSTISISEPSKLRIVTLKKTNPTCEGYPDGNIFIEAIGATPAYTFAINNSSFASKNLFEKLTENKYTIRVRDSNNCTIDTTIQLIGYPKIKLDSTQIKKTRCFGTNDGALSLYASGGNAPLKFVFESNTDTVLSAVYAGLYSKTYTITVIDATNCFKSFQVNVPQPEQLKATTSIVHNDCTGVDTNGSITALIKGGTEPYSYKWSFNNSTEMQISGLSNGIYSLWGKDYNGCADSLTAEVYYDNCCTPSIPNAFTPNNDGKNDVFRIIYKGDVILKELSIYNRYGQRVFTSNNLNQGWDGNFNGQPEELGVYYYMLRMICGNLKNKEIFLKGDVTLIR